MSGEEFVDRRKLTGVIVTSKEDLRGLRRLIEKDPTAAIILSYLVEQSNDHRAAVKLSEIEKVIAKSRPTITKAIQLLIKNGHIARVTVGNHNEYIATPHVYSKTFIEAGRSGPVPAVIVSPFDPKNISLSYILGSEEKDP